MTTVRTMPSILVTLNANQIAESDAEASRRQRHNRGQGYSDRYAARLQTQEQNALNDRMGAAAEKAVAYEFDLPWTGKGGDPYDPRDGDAGTLQVRWSRNRVLYLHPEDRPGTYVAVTGNLPTLEILGYFDIADVTDRHWRTDIPYPAYVIPAEELRDPNALYETAA